MVRKYPKRKQELLDLLADGKPHSLDEIVTTLDTSHGALWDLVKHTRRLMREDGHDIICEFRNRRTFYRHVILLNPDASE